MTIPVPMLAPERAPESMIAPPEFDVVGEKLEEIAHALMTTLQQVRAVENSVKVLLPLTSNDKTTNQLDMVVGYMNGSENYLRAIYDDIARKAFVK